MHLPNRRRDSGRRNDVAHAPSRNAVGLRHSVDNDRALPHAIQHDGGNVLGAVINDVLINLVGNRQNIPLLTEICDQLELAAAEYLTGRVIRSVDDDRLRLVVESRGQLLFINGPVWLMELDIPGRRAGYDRVRAVIFIERLEHDDFIAGVDDCQ